MGGVCACIAIYHLTTCHHFKLVLDLFVLSASQHFSHDERLGLVLLDRYRIVKKLGSGGMGDVYEGVHELIGKKLAIKCLHVEFSANTEAVARFKREARAATAVGNEHIVDVSDIGELPDGSPFMVMEFLKGQELAGLIDGEESLPIPRVIKIVLEILEALQAAHDCGVVHRDMKPENVFLIERGGNPDFVKVLDFGISMISEHADVAKGRMTQTGIAMGTPNYMSPEQAKGDRGLDHRTDLYSVGVILYEALTKKAPFHAGTLAVLMTKILTEQPTSLLAHRRDIPVDLDRIVLRAMAKEPEVRFESAEEFADALRPFLEQDYAPRASSGDNLKSTVPLQISSATEPLEGEMDATAEVAFRADRSNEEGSLPAREELEAPVFSNQTLLAAGIGGAKSKSKVVWAVGAALLLAGVAGFALTRSSDDSEQHVENGKGKVQAQTPTQPAMPPDAVPEKVIEDKEVVIKITTVPANASVFVNGAPFPSGEEVNQPRTTESVRIMVSLDGYRLHNAVAIFDRDRQLHYALQPLKVDEPETVQKGKNTGKKSGRHGRNAGNDHKQDTKISKPETPPETPKDPVPNPNPDSKFRDTFE